MTSSADFSLRVPLNCFFEIDDYESKWDFSDPFDFVHGRNLGGTVRDFPVLLQRAKENMNNGAWIELVDFAAEAWSDDDSLERAPNVVEWSRLLDEASVKFGKQLSIGKSYKQWVTDAGFKNVTEEVYKVCCPFQVSSCEWLY